MLTECFVYNYLDEVLLNLISELCVNLPVVYSPFRKCHRNSFYDISPPSKCMRSLNLSKLNAGEMKCLLFSKLFLMLLLNELCQNKDKFFTTHT